MKKSICLLFFFAYSQGLQCFLNERRLVTVLLSLVSRCLETVYRQSCSWCWSWNHVLN